jgi:peroxiredoxin Q/BCP
MNVGDILPNILFQATSGIENQLSDYQGQWLVLYFYPKDATPGCTIEGRDFGEAYPAFQALNTVVFGISRDSLTSHTNFKCKLELPFELISDEQEALCQLFDVIKMKSMYGKKMRGIERSTFIINNKGELAHEWRKVKVVGHVEEVIKTVKALQTTL